MVSEEQKIRAETLRILGIAFITPMAKFLLDPHLFFREHNFIYTIGYVLCAIIVGLFGFTQIEIARGILDKKESQWRH